MKKNRLGKSDLYVSALGLGCMSLGTNEKQAQEIIETALEEGINYFDTADLYDFGENEKIVGKSLKPYRSQIVLATKVGNRWNQDQSGWSWDPSKKYIKEAVKDSLRRLQTDYIDVYQLHGGTIEDNIEESIEAFEDLKSEGVIRYYGISSIRPNVIREYVDRSSIISIMMQYSLLDRRPEELFPLLKEHQISVVTRGPVAKGLLTENWRNKLSVNGYLDYTSQELDQLLSGIKEKLTSNTRSMTELAIQFNLANEPVTSVVAGASSVKQLKANAKAANATPLTQEEHTLLQSLSRNSLYKEHRN
ncbi:aldo/keto reductase [Bacillus sp. FJAT-49736]|uniref:aldo/keto reductase n=1 Tax=Bacillus sp. FJAT-49736 TaxID=2833582 RepID=UPI001BC9D9A7|nr:aldo/keto reductase [Bacillus sp. FJAT-49736]MBS4173353.1 aldo/keto reductase [Bacillus sp. FJAT-49736]